LFVSHYAEAKEVCQAIFSIFLSFAICRQIALAKRARRMYHSKNKRNGELVSG
jgi:hypothetical protein